MGCLRVSVRIKNTDVDRKLIEVRHIDRRHNSAVVRWARLLLGETSPSFYDDGVSGNRLSLLEAKWRAWPPGFAPRLAWVLRLAGVDVHVDADLMGGG